MKWIDELVGTELFDEHGEIKYVAFIDINLGMTTKGLDNGEEYWCVNINDTKKKRWGVKYEDEFIFALHCIFAGVSPNFKEWQDALKRNVNAPTLFLDVGECASGA